MFDRLEALFSPKQELLSAFFDALRSIAQELFQKIFYNRICENFYKNLLTRTLFYDRLYSKNLYKNLIEL